MNVKVYYNEVVVKPNAVVHPNCPYINLPIEEAKSFAEGKVRSGEWFAYLIPELMTEEVIFEQ